MAVSPARATAFDILMRVEREGAYATELLHSDILEPLAERDRGLATELVMGVLRWRSRLDASVAAASWQKLTKLDPEVLTALRLAAYQVQFLERVPARAAVNESVELVKRARKASAAGYVNAVLRKLKKPGAAAPPATPNALAEHYSHPAWLADRWVREFGFDVAGRICRHDQQVPATAVRLDDPALAGELAREGIELAPGELLTSARRVVAGDVTRTAAFREGRVAIQDEASQLVALLVGRGRRLLDCCAAPGGKTAALAARNPTSTIIAAELHPHRARLLQQRVTAANVRVLAADATRLPLASHFDRVLADVPCSGTGTLARNPEIKWRLRPDDLSNLHARQVAIVDAALDRLAPGGKLVYATCSLEPEEDEEVIAAVLASRPEARVLPVRAELEALRREGELAWPDLDSLVRGEFLRTLPGRHPCDGFFAAVLTRS
jgi:16S rRNA (cytosine967-C5)-methyltransferase